VAVKRWRAGHPNLVGFGGLVGVALGGAFVDAAHGLGQVLQVGGHAVAEGDEAISPSSHGGAAGEVVGSSGETSGFGCGWSDSRNS